MTQPSLRKRLGSLPHCYKVETPTNDRQVVINGPAGQAVITEIGDDEDYEIETNLDRQNVRVYSGHATPRAALEKIVQLNSISLTMIGVAPPREVSRRRVIIEAVVVGLVLVLAVVGIVVLAYTDDSEGQEPTAPVTWSPATTLEAPGYIFPSPTPGATR